MTRSGSRDRIDRFLDIINIIFWALFAATLLFGLVMTIFGAIIHKRCGYYPSDITKIPAMLKFKGEGLELPYYMYAEKSIEFMSGEVISTILGWILFIQLVIGWLNSFFYSVEKTIASFVFLAAAIILYCLDDFKVINIKYELLSIIVPALLIISFFIYKGSEGFARSLFAVGAFLFNVFIYPLIMFIIQIGLRNAIMGLLSFIGTAIVVIILLMTVAGGAGGGVSSGGGSSRGNDAQRAKKAAELDRINRKLENTKHGLQKHNEGSIDYGFVDPNTARNEINKYEKEKKRLEDELR